MIAKRAVLQEGLEPSGDYTIGVRCDCYNRRAMSVYETVRDYVGQHKLVPEGERVIVAVSGGADSRCALDCLHRMGANLIAAHLDHGLRPESAREAEFVREFVGTYGHPFVRERWNAPDDQSGVEEAARWARYRFLVRVATERGATCIATGHTLSDQAETILLHLVRGTGLEGLTGMEPCTPLSEWSELNNPESLYLIRPLLRIRHAEALAYCGERGLDWIEDPSNVDPSYARNLVRGQVMPLLEQLNPQAERSLARAGHSLRPVRDLLDELGENAWNEVVSEAVAERVAFQRERFSEKPLALRLWLVRRAVSVISEGAEVGYETTTELARAIAERGYRPARLPPGIELIESGDRATLVSGGMQILLRAFPQIAAGGERPLGIPGELDLDDPWRIRASVLNDDVKGENRPSLGGSRWREVIDLRKGHELKVRAVRPGDRIQPLGMQGHVKIGDLFTNERIPVSARASWPLVTTESGSVVWVVGLRLSHAFRVREGSDRILLLEALPPDET